MVVVPRLLMKHLGPVLEWRLLAFVVQMVTWASWYRRRFARPDDDTGLRNVKRTFLPVGVIYNLLARRVGKERALAVTQAFLFDLANSVQGQAYLPPPPQPRTWDWFHDEHEAQIVGGFIRNNENDGIIRTDRSVRLNIVRCRFFEAFRDMGEAALTEAFCRSDETVFNEYSPHMRFHRGSESPNTIARGAKRCAFIFERLDQSDAGQ